ncbi:MAG: PD-(D/E)XK motif protein [Bacteroidetes bacterium]|nr:PD-(D/E)XK motif protein [Bacteroidota bacterium]
MERVHIFTSEQLNPPVDKQVIIASVFTKQSSSGLSISDLLESIQNKLSDISLMDKLFSIVAKTLGNTVEQPIRIKYDYNLANSSIRFYRHQDISKIERLSIPDRVSEVKYKSELTDLPPIDPNTIESDGELFRAI